MSYLKWPEHSWFEGEASQICTQFSCMLTGYNNLILIDTGELWLPTRPKTLSYSRTKQKKNEETNAGWTAA